MGEKGRALTSFALGGNGACGAVRSGPATATAPPPLPRQRPYHSTTAPPPHLFDLRPVGPLGSLGVVDDDFAGAALDGFVPVPDRDGLVEFPDRALLEGFG